MIYLSDGERVLELTRETFRGHVFWQDYKPLESSMGPIGTKAFLIEASDEQDALEHTAKLLACKGLTTTQTEEATGCKWIKLFVKTVPNMSFPCFRTPIMRERDREDEK